MNIRAIGDAVPVLVQTLDGWTYVWHTPEEYRRLWAGVDSEAAAAMESATPP